jgi:hypothetical protein
LREDLSLGRDKAAMLRRSDRLSTERGRIVTILKFESQPVVSLDGGSHGTARHQTKQLTALFIVHAPGRMNRMGERLPAAEFAGKPFDHLPRARQGTPDTIDKFIEGKIAFSRHLFKVCCDC